MPTGPSKPAGKAACQGILGRLFGHRFRDDSWDSAYYRPSDHCSRCGMPKGGWP